MQNCERRNVAILGGGFIGANLAMYLANKGYLVNVIDRHPQADKYAHLNIRWIDSSIEHVEYLRQTVHGCQTVFHLFSSTVPGDKVSLEHEISNNIYLLSAILDMCIAESVERFIFMSSASVYGLQGEIPISEKAAALPISTHGLQKLAMENLINIKTRHEHLMPKILRLANPFGPGQNLYGRQGFVAITLGHLLKKTPVRIRGTGEAVRDFICIDDVMNACGKLIQDDSSELIYNLGSGVGVSLNQIIAEIELIINKKIPVDYIEARQEDIPVSVLDTTKIQYSLGFRPYLSLREGLEKLVKHHQIISGKNT